MQIYTSDNATQVGMVGWSAAPFILLSHYLNHMTIAEVCA